MPTLSILAPLDGWCSLLDEVPDPVFAGRMLGDGLAIDPTNGLVAAPCAGEVVTVAAGGHAVSVRAAGGIDVLVHVGIDTVQLAGRGFEVLVRPGQAVAAGAGLIRFDLDAVARAARSLVTPIVVTSVAAVAIVRRRASGPVRAGELLFELDLAATPQPVPASDAMTGAATLSRVFAVPLRHGLHARPAALLAQRVRALAAEVSIEAHGKRASARSVVAIMALGVRHQEEVTVHASGPAAAAALDAFAAALAEALRSEAGANEDPAAAQRSAPAPARSAERPAADGTLVGIAAVGGFAVGVAVRLARPELEVREQGAGATHESRELERARAAVRARLTRLGEDGGVTRREIVAAHVEFLDDPMLNETAEDLIARGRSAGFAWRAAIRRSIAELEALGDQHLRERADDLLDVESQVLLALAGETRPMRLALPERAVLIADDLLPTELVALDRGRLAAICLGAGGATSHVAILAAAMDVPMLVGLGAAARTIVEGATLIVDADRGCLRVSPPAADVAAAERRANERHASRAVERAAAQSDCRARDGTRIEVYANIGSAADAVAAVGSGAEGCGLLRTEFLFIDRDTAPTEEEQLAAYQAVADALAGRPLVLRLMDVGGDKPLRYLPLPHEDNPALGLRGIRTVLRHPQLLRTQLRAALRVTPTGVVRLLLPMITEVAELRTVRTIVEEVRAGLGDRAPVQVGAMIETPAAALLAAQLARESDFLSIGSNDLTQYALAMDRGHAELAARIDALHPAVLRLIDAAARGGVAAGRAVAVCGGVAADSAAVPLLLGLGVRELSVVPAVVPAVKRLVRTLDLADCATLAARCLELESAAEVRALVGRLLPATGVQR